MFYGPVNGPPNATHFLRTVSARMEFQVNIAPFRAASKQAHDCIDDGNERKGEGTCTCSSPRPKYRASVMTIKLLTPCSVR